MRRLALTLTALCCLTGRAAASAQDAAAAAVQKAGGKVEVDETASGKPVVGVNLTSTRVKDTGISCLKDLPGLRKLNLSLTDVTDKGLVNLKGLTELRSLDLSGRRSATAGWKTWRR